MVRVLTRQASHTYGVLDPLVIERRDTKFLGASLADAGNVIMLPQGGYIDRGGTTRKMLLRRKLAYVPLTVDQLSAPNGGTVANLIDSDSATVLTTGAVAGDPFVVAILDFGAPVAFCAVDLIDFKAVSLFRNDCVHVQYESGVSWIDIVAPHNLSTVNRSRRFAQPPSAGNLTAQRLRVTITGGAGVGAISLGAIKLLTETDTLSDAVVRAFNYELGTNYQMVYSENSLDVMKDGVWQAAVPATWTESQIRSLKRDSDYDTVLHFAQFMQSLELQRQGSDREWSIRPVPFTNTPRVDYGGVYTNGVDEVQKIRLYGLTTGASDAFQLILDGNKTDEIQVGASWAVAATNTKAALELLPGVAAGLTVTSPAAATIEVTFTGGSNAGRDWPQMEGLVFASGDFISVSTVTKGKAPGEDLFSTARGWAAVGRFAQERLLQGGFPQRPGTYINSVSGEVYNNDTELSGPIAAFSFDLAGEQNSIRDFFVGRTIVTFTDSAPYHLATPVLDATEAPVISRSDAPGIDANLPALSLANSLYYVQRGGQTIIKLNYSELEKNFIGENASVLSASLVNFPKDWTLRRSTEGNDSDLLMFVNNDGVLVTLTIMSAQEVSGFAPHFTTGKFTSLCVDGNENVWLICERATGSGQRMVYEKMEPDLQLDSAIEFSFDLPVAAIAGLDAYEGQEVYAIADGKVTGPYMVEAGGITLPAAASQVRVGFWTAPFATDTPFQPEEEQDVPMARNKRVFGVDVSVVDTTSIALAVNGNVAVPLVLNGAKTGTLETEGWPGFTRDAQVTVTQTKPGRLLVRAVKKRMAA